MNKSEYFNKVKVGDNIFGLLFGKGKVANVWGEGYYTFEVEYESNGQVVPYTPDGIPAWSNNLELQTAFYEKDINLMDYDFSTCEKLLSIKKIIKLRSQKKLEIKSPSGLWRKVEDSPSYLVEDYLSIGKLHLFRKES